MTLSVCGLLILLGVIFAVMILVGLRWCGHRYPPQEDERERLRFPNGPPA